MSTPRPTASLAPCLAVIVLSGLCPVALRTAGAAGDADRFEQLYEAAKYTEALAYAQQVLRTQGDGNGRGTWLHNVGMAYDGLGKYKEAETAYRESYALLSKVLGAEHANIALSRSNLANTLAHLGRYPEAEAAQREAIRIREKLGGAENPALIQDFIGLGGIHLQVGRYAEAEQAFQRSMKILQKTVGQEHVIVAAVMTNLGALYQTQGKYEQAEATLKAALKMHAKLQGVEHPDYGQGLNNLGGLYVEIGRMAEGERLLKAAAELFRRKLGPDHTDTITAFNNLATFYEAQGRRAEAEQAFQDCAVRWKKVVGPRDAKTLNAQASLASVYRHQGKLEEAVAMFQAVVPALEESLGKDHPDVGRALTNWSICESARSQFERATELQGRALAILERAWGVDSPQIAQMMEIMAVNYVVQERHDLAAPLLQRAAAIGEAHPISRETLHSIYLLRGEVHAAAGRKEEAMRDGLRAIELLEQHYGQSTGTEAERGKALAGIFDPYTSTALWQAQTGDAAGAFATLERGRARTLLDQMRTAGADVLAGVPVETARNLRQRELAARVRVTSLQHRLVSLPERGDLSADEMKTQQTQLARDLAEAQLAQVETYREIRSASPAQRLSVAEGAKPIEWSAFARWATDQKALFLEYQIGDEASLVFAAGPSEEAKITELTISDDAAGKLGTTAGPLTRERLTQALMLDGKPLVRQFGDKRPAPAVIDRLAALWTVLIPAACREGLVADKYQRVWVVPSGPLSFLPFEVLVVSPGEEPQYALDVLPPISYAPSATILRNLAARPVGSIAANRAAVLTVGDPAFSGAAPKPDLAENASPAARYSLSGKKLPRLPHTGLESHWVADLFQKAGKPVTALRQQEATEARVTSQIGGKFLVHIATHGMVDQKHGNLFGSLAFAPGPQAAVQPADDGFLTLAEVYSLNLQGNELVILSACDTNFGPDQEGEGTWSLARGFLAAGSCRVIASNWLVDDEAAATQISYLCTALAAAYKDGAPVDYAAKLQTAKRLVRKQEKWQSPYYWGPFVLVGAP